MRNTHNTPAGKVWLVGAGPGDPDLLTVKAIKAIRQATLLLVDDLVSDGCLRYARASTRRVYVGKRGGCKSTPQAFIEKMMIAEAQAGQRVVRLKGGDPLIFGRAGEELAALRAAGVEVEVVNGITAALAAVNAVGASLTHRDLSHGVVLASAHLKDGNLSLPWQALVDANMTLVFYMGVANAAEVQAALSAAGMPSDMPVAIVERASTPQERVTCATLGTFAVVAQEQEVQSPALLLVGKALAAAGSHYRLADLPGELRGLIAA